jgi:acetoin utilization protein AcuB
MTPSSPEICVSNVMTSHVRTAEPSLGLPEIWRILMDEGCHHIPILEDGQLIGMVSTRDLVDVARKSGVQTRTSNLYEAGCAREIMNTDLQTIYMSDPVDLAIDRIGRGDIHALLVLDDDEKLVGIVTNHDLLHYLID